MRPSSRTGKISSTGPSGLITPSSVPATAHSRQRSSTLPSLPSARLPIQRQPRATRPSGNEPWTLTQSQKTGTSQRGSRPRSAASRVRVSSTSPISSGRGDHTDAPTPSTQPAMTMRPASDRGRPGEPPHHGAEHPGERRHQDAQAVGAEPRVDPAVEQRRQPALHDPRLAGRGERVGVVARDAVVEDQPAGGQVGEEAVVGEPVDADRQAPHREADAEDERGDRRPAPRGRRRAGRGGRPPRTRRSRLDLRPRQVRVVRQDRGDVARHVGLPTTAASEGLGDVDDRGADARPRTAPGRCRTPSGSAS